MSRLFRFALPVAALCLGAGFISLAQDTVIETDSGERIVITEDRQKFWECSVGEGTFLVSLGNIGTVSKHTYVVDGSARVFETTVSTRSSVIARFYFIEPVTSDSPLSSGRRALTRAEELLERGAERIGAGDVLDQVVKNYPASTHAHTVEFRLEEKGDVDTIFSSARGAWRSGRGARITVRAKAD